MEKSGENRGKFKEPIQEDIDRSIQFQEDFYSIPVPMIQRRRSKILQRTIKRMRNIDKVYLFTIWRTGNGMVETHESILKGINPDRKVIYSREVKKLVKQRKLKEVRKCPNCGVDIIRKKKNNKRIRIICKGCGNRLLPEDIDYSQRITKGMPLEAFGIEIGGYKDADYLFEDLLHYCFGYIRMRIKPLVDEILYYIKEFNKISKDLDHSNFSKNNSDDLFAYKHILSEIFERVDKFRFYFSRYRFENPQVSWEKYFEYSDMIKTEELDSFYDKLWTIVEELKNAMETLKI